MPLVRDYFVPCIHLSEKAKEKNTGIASWWFSSVIVQVGPFYCCSSKVVQVKEWRRKVNANASRKSTSITGVGEKYGFVPR